MSEHGPVRERIGAVLANGNQGSGYLISSRLFLTAAHVVENTTKAQVVLPGVGKVSCEVVWSRRDDRCDVAVLLTERSIGDDSVATSTGARLGSISSLNPLPNCQAIGFPRAQRDSADRLDSEQLVGTLKPGTNLLRRRYVLDNVHTPPMDIDSAVSPWAGFSGAVIFYSDVVIGIVGHDPANWQHGRIEATSITELYSDQQFRELLEKYAAVDHIAVPDDLSPDSIFEEQYRGHITTRHGTLTIFGIDLSDRSQAEWPLDAAYLSLESVAKGAPGQAGIEEIPQAVRPADRALEGHDRVLLRGVAGSGKTTLVQWLAVSTAKREMDGGLEHLYGRVPFVLPLRSLIRNPALPLPGEFLSAARTPLSGLQPHGWAERILIAQRGLILVDGIDEISEENRERVRNWLRELLAAFPGNCWLVTSRPSAVSDDWLASDDFLELSLSPMNHQDVATFVHRWHSAAGLTCRDADEGVRLVEYEARLLATLRSKQDLRRLATNPLMCGLICALHRDRRGYLPPGRKHLYDAALSMLIARRDRERDLEVQITEEPQIQILQKLAYWLIRNGQVEMDRSDAIGIIETALPSIPILNQVGTAEQIYKYLLVRSGVLREPTDGVMDFIHRTFQDYLGAKAAVEARDFDLMVKNAHHDQWEDVIRMAVAHAYPTEKTRLLNKLIKRGDRVQRHKTRIYLLAMACLDQAAELNPEVRREIEKRASELIPPSNHFEAEGLANAGPMVLDLLPGPEGLTSRQARSVVETISIVGTDSAIPALARFRDHPSPEIQDTLARQWANYDVQAYGHEIISHMPEGTLFWVSSERQLRFLHGIGGRSEVIVNGNYTSDVLIGTLNPEITSRLGIHVNDALAELSFLRNFQELRVLFLFGCPLVRDLSPIVDLSLHEISINEMAGMKDGFSGLSSMRHLRRLGIFQEIPSRDLSVLPREAPLERLYVSGPALDRSGLRGLREYSTVKQLSISARAKITSHDWREANQLPRLEDLAVDRSMIPGILEFGETWPSVKYLRLLHPYRGRTYRLASDVSAVLAEFFPGIEHIVGIFDDEERRNIEAAFPTAKIKFGA
ncbi:NACHT domain-containing protein [Streptomyces asoensis]|uniref:NACHT domain-containing protein n=1 Tax=Streptomyces asoensis TaxID=249586 RepID=UPI0033276DD3